MHTGLKITGALNYFQDNIRDERILFWVFGAIISIALYNLIVFISTKDRNYLYYFLYIFFMLMYDITVEGFGRYYLWPNWHWFLSKDYNIFMSLSFVFVLFFAKSFLSVKTYSSKLLKVYNITIIIFILNILLFMLPLSEIIINFTTLCFFYGIMLLFLSGLYISLKGYRPARFYIVAWIFLIVGSAATTLRRVHVLPDNILTEYAIYFGTVVESILLAFALGDRVLMIQNKKLEAEEALIDANNRILQNRMKPHFLFNSMNIIFNQILESPKGAMESLQLLSDNYHFITEFNDKRIVKLQEEVNFLKNYLDLMKLRWPDILEIIYNIDDELSKIPVPPFILQPPAENAFKYSLNKMEQKEIEIKIHSINGIVHLEIINLAMDKLGHVDYSRSLGNIINRLKGILRTLILLCPRKNRILLHE
ncbi:sensor histidine kinase [Thiospirochaeta perfilievii]|nr:7TM diverse intracellular signaling domain-containing protein [Thiospirochaeta perfilievii]